MCMSDNLSSSDSNLSDSSELDPNYVPHRTKNLDITGLTQPLTRSKSKKCPRPRVTIRPDFVRTVRISNICPI